MADKIATRDSYGAALVEAGAKYENLVVMDADLSGSTRTSKFRDVYPDRFFNMGIAESNMYAVAAGLAASGKIVCASTFAMFATGRAFEIIRNSIGYPGLNVKICATHAGISVGEDGASHQTFEDIALMRTIPGMNVIVPSDDISAKKLMAQALELNGPCYLRFGRSKVPVIYDQNTDIKIGKAHTVREGNDITIIAAGIMVDAANQAAEQLAASGIEARVLDMHTIKPLDEAAIIAAAQETGAIVTAEEHSVIGGLGEAVAGTVARTAPCPIRMIGQKDVFGESGTPDELLKKYEMTAADIIKAAQEIIKK